MPIPLSRIWIVAVLLLMFGGKKIPELMKGLGQGMKEFKKASRMEDEVVEKTPIESNVRE
jgi:sec-independent protein translocase protein TatA